MLSAGLRPAASAAALSAWLLLAVPPVAAGGGEWRVYVRGTDFTRAADPVVSGGVLLVDLAALAPALRLRVRAGEGAISIRDAEGVEWRGEPGDPVLEAPGRTLPLSRPIRIEGRSARLPVEAVCELAGLRLTLDVESRKASLDDRDEPVRTGALGSGWETFTLAKPAVPSGQGRAGAPSGAYRPLLPPDHETLRLGLGIGHVQGLDWGGELTATGSVRGIETGIAAFLTSGPLGLDFVSGHALLSDRDRGWGVEAGDLFSELRGSARGLRLLRDRDDDRSEGAAFSLYLDDPRLGEDAVLAFRHERRLGAGFSLGGELASDGSWIAQSRLRGNRLELFAYHRETPSRIGAGATGFSGFVEPLPGLLVQGSLSRSGQGDRRIESRTLSLGLPLWREADLLFEAGRIETAFGQVRSGGAVLALPVGPVGLRGRYQLREGEFGRGMGRPARWEQEELLLSASWFARMRLRLEAQLAARRTGSAGPELHGQLQTAWTFTRRTALHLLASDRSLSGTGLYRLRLEHELSPGFSLQAEYGDVPSYQPDSLPHGGPLDERARFKLTVLRAWDVKTPAGGESVEGRVAGPFGPAPAGLPVQLGAYRALTDAAGRFAFPNLPRGRYEIWLPEEALPAGYESDGRRAVELAGRGGARVDLPLVPLGEVRGSVWVDRNGDGRRGADEGVPGVVLLLDGRATASGADGAFGFHNLEPGTHELRIDASRLPRGLAVAGPSLITMGLPPGRSLDGLELRLRPEERPIVFQRGAS